MARKSGEARPVVVWRERKAVEPARPSGSGTGSETGSRTGTDKVVPIERGNRTEGEPTVVVWRLPVRSDAVADVAELARQARPAVVTYVGSGFMRAAENSTVGRPGMRPGMRPDMRPNARMAA